ncbi:hypothetical protein IJG89_03515, partial [Candidatus Saccharibacteria bacterium]|nr:hypothetical protein [Candidatus Saccharibacteria bacterium]
RVSLAKLAKVPSIMIRAPAGFPRQARRGPERRENRSLSGGAPPPAPPERTKQKHKNHNATDSQTVIIPR